MELNNLNENELVVRLRFGDVKAFNAIYNKYHSGVYANILKLTRDTLVTEDILQEVFISLWEKRLSVDAHKSVSGWLFVISYNKSIDYLKKALRESVMLNASSIENDTSDETESDLSESQSKLLEEAISKLSPQKRKVFELCKIQGKSYDETAKDLAISKHTVKEYLSAATAYIKTYIKEHPDYRSTCLEAALLSIIFMS